MKNDPRARRPLVSVIMAAFNSEKYVGAALESVLAQDWEPFEVVVVDDGSQDRTAEIVRSFPGIRYVRQENAGPAAARNAAIAHSKGELVANFDSDDLLPPSRLRVQATYLIEHPQVGCVFGRQEWLNAQPWMARDVVYGDVDGIPLSSAMFRRSVLIELGGYDSAFEPSEDTDLVIRMRARSIEHVVLPDIVLYRRFHETSLTGGRPIQQPLLGSLRAKLERERGGKQAFDS
jgi:glycosyltransferase involved in cell wall biosynthesis